MEKLENISNVQKMVAMWYVVRGSLNWSNERIIGVTKQSYKMKARPAQSSAKRRFPCGCNTQHGVNSLTWAEHKESNRCTIRKYHRHIKLFSKHQYIWNIIQISNLTGISKKTINYNLIILIRNALEISWNSEQIPSKYVRRTANLRRNPKTLRTLRKKSANMLTNIC